MYDDIIEEFRKEYEKEIRSIFDPNSGRKTVTKKWLTSIIGGHPTSFNHDPSVWDRKLYRYVYPSGYHTKKRERKQILRVTKIDTRKKEFRYWEERFKANIPPIVEKYLDQVYERYETMHCPDSLLEILPELGVCNDDKIKEVQKGFREIINIIRLEHIKITGEYTLSDREYPFKRPSRLTAEYMSTSKNNLETLLLAASNGYCSVMAKTYLKKICKGMYKHFDDCKLYNLILMMKKRSSWFDSCGNCVSGIFE